MFLVLQQMLIKLFALLMVLPYSKQNVVVNTICTISLVLVVG